MWGSNGHVAKRLWSASVPVHTFAHSGLSRSRATNGPSSP
jgi:hypothetical protein